MSDCTAGKIAFVHIPKTAGVSIIGSFVDRLGASQCLTFTETMSFETFEAKTFVSGHVYLGDIESDPFIFTFVREPLSQISSHLRWIDHISQFDEIQLRDLPASVRLGIQQIKKVDFSDAKSIDGYLQWLPHDSELRVTNLQSEMLAFRRGRVPRVADKELAKQAVANLGRLQFVGVSEKLSADLGQLFGMLGLGGPPALFHANRSPGSRDIDLSVSSIRRVLLKYIQADLRMYDHIVNLRYPGRLGNKLNVARAALARLVDMGRAPRLRAVEGFPAGAIPTKSRGATPAEPVTTSAEPVI